MLVKDCMTRHPIMISPEIPAAEAQKVMAENKVRHLPVVEDGKQLVGLITRQRLTLKPETIGSLNFWEISRYVSDLKVEQVMLQAREVITITPGRTIERAAATMSKHKIGCLPVLGEDEVTVGILTEVDLLTAFVEMLGLPADGIRVTVRMPDKMGEFSKLTSVIAEQGWGVRGIGSFPAPRHPGYYDVVIKMTHVDMAEAKELLGHVPEQEIVDIRTVV